MHTLFESYLEYYGLDWLTPVAEAHLRRFYKRADHVLAPTAELAAGLAAIRGDGAASVWSRGIDRELFSPSRRDIGWRRSLGISDDEVVVLFFGRLVLEKGIDVFVETLQAAAGRAKLRAMVVGEGPAGAKFGKLDRALMLGHLEGEDLARAVASADLMLTPSTTETFGQVILESMASGLPVISADAPNARSLVANGLTGLLCEPRNTNAFADAVVSIARDEKVRAAMGSAGRKASAKYTWDSASKSVAQVYRKLAATG